jgi:hypothetical protein
MMELCLIRCMQCWYTVRSTVYDFMDMYQHFDELLSCGMNVLEL